MILRPYQLESLAGVDREWAAGAQRTLLVLPTGCGKTVVFAELVRRAVEQGHRCLVVAHRTELLKQAQRKLRDAGVDSAIEQGKHRARDAQVVVASVQSLSWARLEALGLDTFSVIIIDEAHHATADGYGRILEANPSAWVLGVTATADRLDGKGLGEVFQSCAFRYELRTAIDEGYLVPLKARLIELQGVDISSVKQQGGDFAAGELGKIMASEEALHGVAVPLLEQVAERRTIVFAVDVAHAHALAEVINRYKPGAARAIDGSAAELEREGVLADFAAREFQILVNCALFTEGFDDPGIEAVAVARMTRSRGLFTQMVGRGTRLSPETGKRDCLVLCFGARSRHSLVGPVDVLAGRVVEDADVRAEFEKRLGAEQLEIDGLLEQVEDELAQRRAAQKVTAVASYMATDVDPFFGDLPELEVLTLQHVSTDSPANVAQLAVLEQAGLKAPENLSSLDAARIILGIKRRKELGLCTYKQARLLGKFGINAQNMQFGEAGRRISECLARGSARSSMRAGGAA